MKSPSERTYKGLVVYKVYSPVEMVGGGAFRPQFDDVHSETDQVSVHRTEATRNARNGCPRGAG